MAGDNFEEALNESIDISLLDGPEIMEAEEADAGAVSIPDVAGSINAAAAANAKSPGMATTAGNDGASENAGGDSADNAEAKKEPVNLVVEGFEFLSKEDVDKAKLDKQKIDILGQKVKPTRVSDMEAVYEKAINSRIFSTPVGWFYLARLRDKLLGAGVAEEDLIPIPVTYKIARVDLEDEYHPRQYVLKQEKKVIDKRATTMVLITMNVILVLMVIAMFVVTWYSETDNIINYRNNVTNRYAEWEQSLQDREKAVRLKERELGIADDTPYANDNDVEIDN